MVVLETLILDAWLWILCFGLMVWIPGFGFLSLDSWVWIPGFGFLSLESWALIPELGFSDLAENQNLKEKPVKTYDLETEIATHEVPLTKPWSSCRGTRPGNPFLFTSPS